MGITVMRHGEHVNKSVVSMDCKNSFSNGWHKFLVRFEAILNLTGIMKTRLWAWHGCWCQTGWSEYFTIC